ncbi:MAG: hypothetical protein WCB94_12400, partial [Terriglobales bacterium]
ASLSAHLRQFLFYRLHSCGLLGARSGSRYLSGHVTLKPRDHFEQKVLQPHSGSGFNISAPLN